MKLAKGLRRYTGLMLRTTKSEGLIFNFSKPSRQPVHSYFCPTFIIYWFDINNKMIDVQYINDWHETILPNSSKHFTKIIEIPVKYVRFIERGLDE